MKKLIILAVALVALLGVSDAQQQLCAAHDFTCFCNRYVNVYAGEDPTVGGLPLTIGQLIENRAGRNVCIATLARDMSNITMMGLPVGSPLVVDSMSSFEFVSGSVAIGMAYATLLQDELPAAFIESGRQIQRSLNSTTTPGTVLQLSASNRWLGVNPPILYLTAQMIGDPLLFAEYTKKILDAALLSSRNPPIVSV